MNSNKIVYSRSKSRKSLLIEWILMGIVFLQNPPWFLWENSYFYLSFLVLVLTVLCLERLVKNPFVFTKQIPLIICLLIFFVFYSSFGEFRFSSIVTILIFILLFVISEKEKIAALKLITTLLSIIIGVSLVAWLFHNNVSQLPMYGFLNYGIGKGDEGNTVLKNYILFIEVASDTSNRFYSIFDEPGVLGTLAGFVLFANKYNFRNKLNIIIFIGGLFTFSLAFIGITILGVLLNNLKSKVAIIKGILALVFLLSISFFVLKNNETFQMAVVNRIINIDESGIDSRTSDHLNRFFNDFILSSDLILGKGTSFFKENVAFLSGQGYKLFIIEYGLIGFCLILLMYLTMAKKYSKVGYLCLSVFFLSFLQRPALFTAWQVVLFSLSVVNLYYLNNKNIK